MRSAVVTLAAGRHRHLSAQRRALEAAHPAPDLHVVVAMGDPSIRALLDEAAVPTRLVEIPAADTGLPLAAARNAGASEARRVLGDDVLLVFLDVDCLPAPDLVARYAAAARQRPDAVLCGPVTYLPEHDGEWSATQLAAARAPHPARPDPPAGVLSDADPSLFWSLSFATTAATWDRVGGFDEGYVGYGAEDTDFARRAVERDVPLLWVGGADAFHQHHPTSTPPIQHVDDLLRNGSRFAQRWGEWPMGGWLQALQTIGMVTRSGPDYVRPAPVRLATIPARHPYVDAVRPDTAAVPVRPDRVAGWDPDPLLTVDYLERVRDEIDVVHVHFGFEHRSVDDLREWVTTLHRLALPLVVTVHDLHNPHLEDNTHHAAQLRVLLAAAAHVITLTAGAAAEIRTRYERVAEVLAHPTLLDAPPPPHASGPGGRKVFVPLGPMRANLAEPGPLVSAVAAGTRALVDTGVLVAVRPERLDDPRLDPVRELAAGGAVILDVAPRVPDAVLNRRVSAADVLVLPYRFGTHSGWLELARDLGVRSVVPSTGYYAEQDRAAVVFDCDDDGEPRPASLTRAVEVALAEPRPEPADPGTRRAQRALIRARHEIAYRAVVAR